MIEQVARSLARCAWERFKASDNSWAMAKYPGGADQYCAEQWQLYANDARAAIEAMRTPTEAMLKAGGAVEVPRGYGDEDWNEEIGEYEAESAYTAMISAALSPSGEK